MAIFRINPFTGKVTRWLGGLTSAVDLTFDRHGNLYVAELFGGNGGGAVKKVSTRWSWKGLQAGQGDDVGERCRRARSSPAGSR